jgi:hypothetical protein
MPKQQTRMDTATANAALAYKFWLERCFRDGSPEEDLFRAVCANSLEFAVEPRSGPRLPSSKHRWKPQSSSGTSQF